MIVFVVFKVSTYNSRFGYGFLWWWAMVEYVLTEVFGYVKVLCEGGLWLVDREGDMSDMQA